MPTSPHSSTNQSHVDGQPLLTPYLVVRDASSALSFYQRAYGFERGHSLAGEDGRPLHCELLYRGQLIVMLAPEGAFGSTSQAPASLGQHSSQSFYVLHDDPDALFERALVEGATALGEPSDMFWGDRVCSLLDPDGYQWVFARKPKRSAAAQE